MILSLSSWPVPTVREVVACRLGEQAPANSRLEGPSPPVKQGDAIMRRLALSAPAASSLTGTLIAQHEMGVSVISIRRPTWRKEEPLRR